MERHRILLVNFTAYDAGVVAKAGFNADMGYISASENPGYRSAILPHPVHEYDIYVYNSNKTFSIANSQFPGVLNIAGDERFLAELNDLRRRPVIRIGLTGFAEGGDLKLFGVPFLRLIAAHQNVSAVQFRGKDSFSFPPLNKTLENLGSEIAMPVSQYIAPVGNVYPVYHLPVLFNKNGDVLGAYGRFYEGTLPLYLLLPQMKDNAAALVEVFESFLKLQPSLFPDIKRRSWYTSPQYAFREEKEIESEIAARVEEVRAYISTRRAEGALLAAKFAFLKEMLVATEEPPEKPERLSSKVRMALEFIGFEVEDIDEKIQGAIRKEDFWVRQQSDYLAITEVSGTKGTNPKTKEYNDILGRMNTIFKRRDLVPDSSNVRGLLILNYDIENPPDKRPLAYHSNEDIVESAKENDIGILSTSELYYLGIAVKDGRLTKEAARAIVMQPGRVRCPKSAKLPAS